VTEHPGEQFPPDVDPDVEPGLEPHPSEETPEQPDYDTEPAPDFRYDEESTERPYDEAEPELDAEAAFEASLEEPVVVEEPAAGEHVDPAEVEFGPEFARAPGQEHEHPFAAESAVPEHSDESAVPPHQPAQNDGPAVPQSSAENDDSAGDEEAGHPLVEETMARLDELRDRPVGEHAEVYADLHERLQNALVEADADHGDRG
jgi:hypothetical protein